MGTIKTVEKLNGTKFLSFYNIKATSVHQTPVNYYMASRTAELDQLKLRTGENHPDGVVIYALTGENRDKVVLIRQYRYTINDYIYEFPAGLVEQNESYQEAAARELLEETGLTFHPLTVDDRYQRPYFTTIGLTDESCAAVYGFAEGTVTTQGEEATEEIEVVLADRKEVARILKEEKVAIMCAYQLMHFLHDQDPFAFLSGERSL